MKIALVTPYFPPTVGGIETYVYELARELSKENEVYVFTCGRGLTESYDGVKIFRLRAIDLQNLPLPLKIPYPIPATLMFKLAKTDFDVIHAHGHAFVTSLQAALAARLIHKPFILTIHDIGVSYRDYLIMKGVRPIVDSTLVRYVFKQADAVIALNKVTYNYAVRFNPRRIVTIPQGIDLELFKPREEEGEYVTFIAARLIPQKGCETFVKVIPMVLEEIEDAKFMVIGDGYQRSHLERVAEELGIRNRIKFVGRVPHRDVPEYLSRSKVVVFPSEIPTGLALLEAAAMKKPIITAGNGWAKDTLGDAPYFVPAQNPKETAEAVIQLLKNPQKRRRIADLVYNKVSSERRWDLVASRHMGVYEEVLYEHGKGGRVKTLITDLMPLCVTH